MAEIKFPIQVDLPDDWIEQIVDRLRNDPEAEWAEVVRCKDCKWYELPNHRITENCVRWMKSNGILLPIKPNDYCSYAERRTDEQTD